MTTTPEQLEPATIAVHAGREGLRDLGVHALPIDLSTTSPMPSIAAGGDAYDLLASGAALPDGMSPIYRRAWNSTVARFEEAVAALETPRDELDSVEAIAFASGMAAMTTVLLSRVAAGLPHIVAVRPLYGGTDALLASGLLGTSVTWADAHDVADAIRPETGLVVIESPANPTLDLYDIRDVVRQAGTVPVLVDSTFATPVLQQPLALGATYALHSATKYIGGHGDAMGGVVATSAERATQLRPIRTITGAVMDPWTAYLLHRGIATLPVRMQAQQANAGEVARWLAEQPELTRVFYPGLPGADPTGLVGRQMAGPGAMVSFELPGGLPAAEAFCAALQLITHAVSLGGIDTLIQHPAALTHRPVDAAARPGEGILRLSIGLEAPVDIIADLQRGLYAVAVR